MRLAPMLRFALAACVIALLPTAGWAAGEGARANVVRIDLKAASGFEQLLGVRDTKSLAIESSLMARLRASTRAFSASMSSCFSSESRRDSPLRSCHVDLSASNTAASY